MKATELAPALANIVVTLAVTMVIVSSVAFVLARKFCRTKRDRDLVFTLIGAIGLLFAAFIAQARLRGLTP